MKKLLFISILVLLTGFEIPVTRASLSKDQISEITFERTGCLGTCPAYHVIFRRDGTVTYEGRAYVERKGEHRGTLDRYYFDRLAELIRAERFFKLKNRYAKPLTDMPSAILSVVRGKKRKTVSDYAAAGPVKLWGIEMAVDAVIARVKWNETAQTVLKNRDQISKLKEHPIGKPVQHRISEITLERTRCFGTCPAYKLVLRRDGTAGYTGRAYVERKGEYRGKVSRYDFDQLAKLLESQGFFDLQNSYWKPLTDMPSVIVSVVRDGQRKRVSNYANAGPVGLWGMEMAIEGVMARLKWEK